MKHYLVILCLLFISIASFGQQNQIKDLEQQRQLMLEQIKNTNDLLYKTQKKTSTLLVRINLISDRLISRKKIVNLLEQEVLVLNKQESQIQKQIPSLQDDLKKSIESYTKAVQAILRNRQNNNQLFFVLSGKSLTESYRRLAYLRNYSSWRKKRTQEIRKKKEELENKKIQFVQSRLKKQSLFNQQKSEQIKLKNEQLDYQNNIVESRKQQKQLQTILIKKKNQASALNREIEKLITQEISRQNKEKKKRLNNLRNHKKLGNKQSVNNKYLYKQDILLSENFAANKGKLPAPINGKCVVVGKFGLRQHRHSSVVTDNNGIDIKSNPGARATAVFNGEVSRVIAFPGYNNCIIIRHGSFYTFYANLKTVYVKTGDRVKIGTAIGQIYTDPVTGSSQLHFQLWKGMKKLDPQQWLRL